MGVSLNKANSSWVDRLKRLYKGRPPGTTWVLTFVVLALWLKRDSPVSTFAVLALVAIHQAGHLWAMRRVGIGCSDLQFFPFIGVPVSPHGEKASARQRWLVAAAGPLWGSAVVLIVFVAMQFLLSQSHDGVLQRTIVQNGEAIAKDRTNFAFALAGLDITASLATLNMLALLPIPFFSGARMLSAAFPSAIRRMGAIVLLTLSLALHWVSLLKESVLPVVLFGSVGIVALAFIPGKRKAGELRSVEVFGAAAVYWGLWFCLYAIFQVSYLGSHPWLAEDEYPMRGFRLLLSPGS